MAFSSPHTMQDTDAGHAPCISALQRGAQVEPVLHDAREKNIKSKWHPRKDGMLLVLGIAYPTEGGQATLWVQDVEAGVGVCEVVAADRERNFTSISPAPLG